MEHYFINVGFGNIVAAGRILSIADPDSAPAKRDMAVLRSKGYLRDYTKGRITRALIYLDDGSAIQSSMLPETLATRFVGKAGKKDA
jgi:regulator of extracellular matrix RemA (YlzA/DUF370 family)